MKTGKTYILLADDDIDYLMQTRLKLKKYGYEVIACESQEEAEQYLEQNKPHLAIFDLMMENDDSGFILAYKLKRKYPEVPVIIATAVASETGISFGIENEAGQNWIKADLYLEKGIRGDKLHEEITKLLA